MLISKRRAACGISLSFFATAVASYLLSNEALAAKIKAACEPAPAGARALCSSYDFSLPVNINSSSSGPALSVLGGNVGIGTNAPAYLLDVNGAINATAVKINGVDVGTGGGGSGPWSVGANGISYSGGKVGIGTSEPTERLQVVNEGDWSTLSSVVYDTVKFPGLAMYRYRGTKASPSTVQNGDFTGTVVGAGFDGSNQTQTGRIDFLVDAPVSTANVPGAISFLTTTSGAVPSEKMRITSGGKVGVGTSVPVVEMDIVKEDASTTVRVTNSNSSGDRFPSFQSVNYMGSASGGFPAMTFNNYRGIPTAPAAAQAGDVLGYLGFNAYSGSAALNGTAILGRAAANWSSSSAPADLLFYTTPSGSAGGAERMRIGADGNVGIGVSAPLTKLQVAGVIAPAADGGYDLGAPTLRFGNIYAVGGIINTSDGRLKSEIKNSDLGLGFIRKLRAVSYRWAQGVDADLHYGFIAQELQETLGDAAANSGLVSWDEANDRFGIRYHELIGPMVKAVQEVDTRLAKAEAENAQLRDAIAKQEALLKELSARLLNVERVRQ